MFALPAFILVSLLVGYVISRYIATGQANPKGLPLPPGPPKLPVIGNLHQAPTLFPWRTFREWSKQYGSIMLLQFGGDIVILLNNHETATALLEKRGNIYSNRPHMVMGGDVVSKGLRTLLLPYGPQYRRHQRIHGSLLLPRMSQHYRPVQDLESKQLIHELLTTSEANSDFMDRMHRYSASLIFSLVYGKRMPRGNEEEIRKVGELMEHFLYSARVGTWIVDAIPALNYLPKFLAPWKRLGDEYHDFESQFYSSISEEAKSSSHWNMTTEAVRMKEAKEIPDKEMAYVLGTVYEAGSDTTTQALHSFVLAAVLHPETMKDAQREIDSVVGDSFPTFDDIERLPLVNAVVKEVLRWRPVSAGGIPHAVTQDDEYNGFFIPKGATVIGVHWTLNLDEEVYGPDALEFRPRRWIEDPDLPLASFGWGRRACTGQNIAMNSLYINIARMLWTFDIKHTIGESGKRVEVDPLAYTQGFNSGPLPFRCKFEVRSERKRETVKSEWQNAEKDIGVLLDTIQRNTSKAGVSN